MAQKTHAKTDLPRSSVSGLVKWLVLPRGDWGCQFQAKSPVEVLAEVRPQVTRGRFQVGSLSVPLRFESFAFRLRGAQNEVEARTTSQPPRGETRLKRDGNKVETRSRLRVTSF